MKANWNKYDESGANPDTACESGSYYYFYDALGNVNGVLEEKNDFFHYYRWEMDAFGNDLPSGNEFLPMDQPGPKEHLTGKLFDTVSGLYYFHARWYDAEVGRFVSRDIAQSCGEIDLTRYSFSGNSPTAIFDPDGNTCKKGDFSKDGIYLCSRWLGGLGPLAFHHTFIASSCDGKCTTYSLRGNGKKDNDWENDDPTRDIVHCERLHDCPEEGCPNCYEEAFDDYQETEYRLWKDNSNTFTSCMLFKCDHHQVEHYTGWKNNKSECSNHYPDIK